MTEPLTPDMLARLETFLDAIEDRLRAADVARDRRRAVADDLETQIRDSLAGLGRSPDVGDLDAVLARLDPPGAYGDTPGAVAASPQRDAPPALPPPGSPPPVVPSRLSPALWRGVAGFGLALCGAVFFVGLRVFEAADFNRGMVRMPDTDILVPVGVKMQPALWVQGVAFGAITLCVIGLILMTVSGWSAARRIGRSRGAYHGLGWAAVEALPVPTALAYTAGMILGVILMNAIDGGNLYTDAKQATAMLIAAAVGTVGTAALVWLFVRVSRRA